MKAGMAIRNNHKLLWAPKYIANVNPEINPSCVSERARSFLIDSCRMVTICRSIKLNTYTAVRIRRTCFRCFVFIGAPLFLSSDTVSSACVCLNIWVKIKLSLKATSPERRGWVLTHHSTLFTNPFPASKSSTFCMVTSAICVNASSVKNP